jgi:hypothetical protein
MHSKFSQQQNPETMKPVVRPTRKGEDNIKIRLKEIVWEGMNLILLAHDRMYCWAFANTGKN